MIFAEDIYYSNVDDFYLTESEASDLGFKIKDNKIIIPENTRFKIVSMHGPSGFPVIEVFGEELDFARTEPFLVNFA